MCTSGGRQCKTVPIPGLRVLVHPNQTWTFPLNDIAIKVAKCIKYEIEVYNFYRSFVCFQYIKLSFNYINCRYQNMAAQRNHYCSSIVLSVQMHENSE